MKQFIHIADLKDPNDPQGRTYRQVNAEKKHRYEIGQLVEFKNGCRLFIVCQTRDCDKTPLYSVSYDKDDTEVRYEGFANHGWTNGIDEGSIVKVVRE